MAYAPSLKGSASIYAALLCISALTLRTSTSLLHPQGLPTPPEQSLIFSVPLGSRESRTFRFRHLLDEKADYRVSLLSSSGGAGGGRESSSREGSMSGELGGRAGMRWARGLKVGVGCFAV